MFHATRRIWAKGRQPMKPMGRIDPRWPVHRRTSPNHIRPKLDDSSKRSHESELTRTGRLGHVGRNFPLAYLLMGLPGLLANVPTSRREHAYHTLTVRRPSGAVSELALLHPARDTSCVL